VRAIWKDFQRRCASVAFGASSARVALVHTLLTTARPGSALTSANAFLAFSLQYQPAMRIDVAVDIWFLELLVAGRLADFHVPRWQSAPTLLDTD
jgi:hypothetical protein